MVQAFRKRVEQLGTTYEAIDEVAGLPTRYVGKLLGPARMKGFGKLSLGALMGATGIKFLVVVDEEAMAKIAGRLTPKHPSVVLREARIRTIRTAAMPGTPSVEHQAEAGGTPTDG
jgi:hypothetical protein